MNFDIFVQKKLIAIISFSIILVVLISRKIFASTESKNLENIKNNQEYISTEPLFIKTEDAFTLIPKSLEEIEKRKQNAEKKCTEDLKNWLLIDEKFLMNLERLDQIIMEISICADIFSMTANVSPDINLGRIALQASVDLRSFMNKQIFSQEIYKKFNDIVNHIDANNLSLSDKFFIEQVDLSFRLSGNGLQDEKYAHFKNLSNQINELCAQFSQNIALFSQKISCKKEDLEGVNEEFLLLLEKDQDGNFFLGVDYPTYFEIMGNCSVENTRKKLFLLFNNRAYPENDLVLKKIVSLRNEMANLLGYPDFATLNIASKMAKTPEKVNDFLQEIKSKVLEASQEEFKKLTEKDLPLNISLDENGKLAPWNYLLVRRKYEQKHFLLDENKIAEYFPLEQTLSNIFTIYQNLLNLKFEIIDPIVVRENCWHPDVHLIKVTDMVNNELLGHLYLDLHPRPGKYTHACCGMLIPPVKNTLIQQKAVTIVLANFPRPAPNKPALLKYDDVRTFFHELGHGMHCLLGHTKFATFAGYNTLWDFVETPSQMFEEWMRDPDVLRQIGKHYQTGETIPEKYIQGMLAQEKEFVGSWTLRQVKLATFSLYLYSNYPSYSTFKELEDIIAADFPDLVLRENDAHFYASFGHLTEYAASYYTYLWSLVFAKDLWSEVKKFGLFSNQTSKLVRDLLSAGGSQDPFKLLQITLGRNPSNQAFMDYISKQEK